MHKSPPIKSEEKNSRSENTCIKEFIYFNEGRQASSIWFLDLVSDNELKQASHETSKSNIHSKAKIIL